MRTGVQGFIYDLRTVILPFMFFFNPELILHVDSWLRGGWVIFSAATGMLAFVAATQGYLVTHMRWCFSITAIAQWPEADPRRCSAGAATPPSSERAATAADQ